MNALAARPTRVWFGALLTIVITLLVVYRPERQAQSVAAAPVVDEVVAHKKLTTLERRLDHVSRQANTALSSLVDAPDDSTRDRLRSRLEFLFRLEAGLEADIARARGLLASAP